MGKKSRRKQIRKEWIKAAPDEVIGQGPLRIERYGRFIRLSNTSTPEEHAALLKRAEEANKEIVADLEREVAALQKLIQEYDPVALMHRAAYVLLPLFNKYRSENEFGFDESYSLPAVEYLQYLIARTPANTNWQDLSEEKWNEIWGKALAVLKLSHSYIFTRKTSATPPSETDDLRFQLDSRRLQVRVHRYPFFLVDYWLTSLSPYEQWIQEIYGVSVNEFIQGLKEIASYQKTGVTGRYRDVIDSQRALAQELRQKGYAGDSEASPEEMQRTREAIESKDFETLRDDLHKKMRLTFTPAIFDITELTTLPRTLLSLLSVKPGESILTTLTGPEHDDLSPLSTSVLHYKPFLEVNGRFYTFYHSGFEDRIAEIIEADLFQKRPGKVSEMAKRRSDRIESDTKDLLCSIIKPDFVFQNVYYPNPDEVGDLTELDILLGVDDILFLVEIKAGGFSEPASRGAPKSMERELSDLIIEGQRQSERAEKYIWSSDEVGFFDETGKKIVHKIKNSNFRKVFRIVVTREELGWVGAKIAILSMLDPNLSNSFPWHISIDDFRIVVELFKDNEVRFIHFLEQRLMASSETSLSQSDEIEHIGLYNKMNQYHKLPAKGMDHISYDASYMREIDYYFAEKGAGNTPELPMQVMSPKMRSFIVALRDSRLPGRFEVGSIVLSMNDLGRNQLQQGLDVLDAGRAEGRQRSVRLPLTALSLGLTVTYADDDSWREELMRSAAQMEQGKGERWLVVQLANESPYRIRRIEAVLPGKFSDADLLPAKDYLEERTRRTIALEKPGRNDSCPCGSGKKYKKCHGSKY